MKKRRSIPQCDYIKAHKQIRNGDLLSFKPRCRWYFPWEYWTWLIALTNRYHICHSAMAVWIGDNLLCVQMTTGSDRIVLLSSYVRDWPGKIIVSRALVKKGFRRSVAADLMLKLTDRPYGWMRIFLLSCARTLTGRLLWPGMSADCDESKWPPVCSEAYSHSMRLAGFDPCTSRPDYRTEPCHLFNSPKYKPLFILI